MKCSYCGTELKEGILYCPDCGEPQIWQKNIDKQQNIIIQQNRQTENCINKCSNKKKRNPFFYIIGIIFVLVLGSLMMRKILEAQKINKLLSSGNDYLNSKNYDKAISEFSNIMGFDKNNYEAKYNLSNAYLIKGKQFIKNNNYAEALSMFNKAILSDNKNKEPYIECSKIYNDKNDNYDQLQYLEKYYSSVKDSSVKTQIDKIKTDLRGNSMNNLSNGGYVAKQGDWVYYRNFEDNGSIYKMKDDRSCKTKITKKPGSYINVVEQWIYYISDDGIYKAKIDGSKEIKIRDVYDDKQFMLNVLHQNDAYLDTTIVPKMIQALNDGMQKIYIRNLNVIGSDLYYLESIDFHAKSYIIHINSDGKLVDNFEINTHFYNFAADKNGLYCWNDSSLINKCSAVKFNLDGTNETNLISSTDNCGEDISLQSNVCFDGENIFFSALTTNGLNEYKQNNLKEINNFKLMPDCTNANNAILYYSTDNGIYKTIDDGVTNIKLTDRTTDKIMLAGDWIYFTGVDSDYCTDELYRIKTDGSNLQKLDDGKKTVLPYTITLNEAVELVKKASKISMDFKGLGRAEKGFQIDGKPSEQFYCIRGLQQGQMLDGAFYVNSITAIVYFCNSSDGGFYKLPENIYVGQYSEPTK